ncbi:hypothetical protein [Rhizobium leguminosarum]
MCGFRSRHTTLATLVGLFFVSFSLINGGRCPVIAIDCKTTLGEVTRQLDGDQDDEQHHDGRDRSSKAADFLRQRADV